MYKGWKKANASITVKKLKIEKIKRTYMKLAKKEKTKVASYDKRNLGTPLFYFLYYFFFHLSIFFFVLFNMLTLLFMLLHV